uniref:Uncharacterized protein n=1 Tax=Naja naja TaxID=35670 RepID=A0A8C6V327_NAJNA
MPSVNKQLSVPPSPPKNLDSRTSITTEEKDFEAEADDLMRISELGRGAYRCLQGGGESVSCEE